MPAQPGQECGGPGGKECIDGTFCEYPPGCNPLDTGFCRSSRTPSGFRACTGLGPFFDCDGNCYVDECEREAAGARLDFEATGFGSCHAGPQICRDDTNCAADMYCFKIRVRQ